MQFPSYKFSNDFVPMQHPWNDPFWTVFWTVNALNIVWCCWKLHQRWYSRRGKQCFRSFWKIQIFTETTRYQSLHFFSIFPKFDPILIYEGCQNKKKQIMHSTKFSHRAIDILLNQGPISSQVFRKNTITFRSILAIFCQKEGRGHTLKGRNQNWFTLL